MKLDSNISQKQFIADDKKLYNHTSVFIIADDFI